MSMDEKPNVLVADHDRDPAHLENPNSSIQIGGFNVVGLSPDDADFFNNFDEKRAKKLYRRIDLRLMPMLAILYLVSHLERSNIGNAKIEGMLPDLGMHGNQYNIVTSVFFIPYVLFAIPSNIILKNFGRPSQYLGGLVIAWGIVMTCTGFINNFGGLIGLRILLGICESGFFPGAIYLSSYWYPPKNLASRISYFYCTSALSSAISGLLAAGIAQMNGLGGYRGWRWIFIIEGLMSVVLGVLCFFFLIDTPKRSHRWLSTEEIRYLELSMFIKQGGKVDEDESGFKWKDLRIVASNWRIYLMAYFLFCQSTLSYGVNFTLPTLVKILGYNNTNAQLMSAPPYLAGSIATLVTAKLNDRFAWRMPFLAGPMIIIIIAYSIIVSLHGALEANKGVTYFAIVLGLCGSYPIQAGAASWNANNLAPASRRAIGIALCNCVGNIGGILGSYMYLESEKPKYPTGFGLSMGLGALGLVNALGLEWYFKKSNEKKARREEAARAEHTEAELYDMGDRSPLFKYVL